MTAGEDGELAASLLMVMSLPHLGVIFDHIFDIGFRFMTQAESKTMSFMILPLIGVCLLAWLIMGIGYWIDSRGSYI